MPSNTHKYIIFTSMGCGGALVIALIVAVLMTQHGGLGRLMRDEPSTLHSPAALDSLAAVRAWYHGQPPARTAYALRPAGAGDGARAALSIWRDTASVVWIPFGDTFPANSRQFRSWGQDVDWQDVDSLLAAARRPWRPGWSPLATPDAERVWRGLLSQVAVLSTARQLMGGARLQERLGRRARADSMVRAVVTLGRRLQQDVATPHVNLGLRLERDALHVLARMYARWGRAPARDSALAAASRADSAVARWRDAVRLIQTAAVLPEHAAALAAAVEDSDWPIALRAEMVLAIGFGWAYNGAEMATGIDAHRSAVLDELAHQRLPPALLATLAAARVAATGDFKGRIEAGSRYRALAQSEWWAF